MGRMTETTIHALYVYGKKVYAGETTIEDAAKAVSMQNPEIAQSSAKHYISWYSKMRVGEFLTWNSNSQLLLYYVKHILAEEGKEAGCVAIESALKFAHHVNRTDLEDDLMAVATENGISISEQQTSNHVDNTEAFRQWLANNQYKSYTEHTVYRYIHALQKAAEWLSVSLLVPVLYTNSNSDFQQVYMQIKSVANFDEINQAHGHGDLSAALSLYERFLKDRNSDDIWLPDESDYTPGITKEQWRNLLEDTSIFNAECLKAMACMYDNHGEGSCTGLAEKYKQSMVLWRTTCGVHLANRIAERLQCRLFTSSNGKVEKSLILYQYRKTGSEEIGYWVYKLRKELYEALSEFDILRFLPTMHPSGIFDSWEIIDENTAIKTCDKSFFEHNGSGVPKEICWFFDAEETKAGDTTRFDCIYGGTTYTLRVSNESSDRRRVRVFWPAELGVIFKGLRADCIQKLRFTRQNGKYTMTFETEGGTEMAPSSKEILDQVKAYIAARGFTYEGKLIENFYLSLKSKPFVILAGTSGTGKTRLVKLFAEAIGAEYKLVPVRPDWSDSSDLFGHVDLNGNFVSGAIIDFIKAAHDNLTTPYILCLDEMNLARVEYYLSDFLSVLETRNMVNGHITSDSLIARSQYGIDDNAAEKYGELSFPENLYIVGTVNMDETTFPFSKKVLDRANTIEFSYVDLMPKHNESGEIETRSASNDFLRSNYLLLAECDDESEFIDEICATLQQINKILEMANAHVGYRVRDEICFYMLNNKKADNLLTTNEALDNEILQKILPRIQGSSASVHDMMCEMFRICAADHNQCTGDRDSERMQKVLNDPSTVCKYRKSAEKLAMMVRRFEDDGFTSYWL